MGPLIHIHGIYSIPANKRRIIECTSESTSSKILIGKLSNTDPRRGGLNYFRKLTSFSDPGTIPGSQHCSVHTESQQLDPRGLSHTLKTLSIPSAYISQAVPSFRRSLWLFLYCPLDFLHFSHSSFCLADFLAPCLLGPNSGFLLSAQPE